MKEYAFRLKKGQDLKLEIEKYVEAHQFQAAVIVSCIGYLNEAILHNVYQKKELIRLRRKKLNILSLNGTLSVHGNHMSLTLIDDQMQLYEGHLREGCVVSTTVEIVILELEDYTFYRELDLETGFRELDPARR